MATFQAQVMALTGINISSSSTNPTEAQLTQYLTDGAKEVINHLPKHLLPLCSAEQSFTSGTPDALNTGKVLNVFRNDGDIKQPCRQIDSSYKGRVLDSDDMDYASVTDPVYYIENNTMDVIPNSGAVTYSEVQHPAVVYSADSISIFPDEAEYLVPLYASIKSLQNALSAKSGNSNITTALTAINTELNETQAICDLVSNAVGVAVTQLTEAAVQVDADVDTALSAINTAADRVNAAVVLANTQFDSAVVSNTAEDIELASSQVNAGKGFLSEASSSANEAQTYANEVNARISQVNGYNQVISGYLNAAQGYANEIQAKIQIAQGYGNEVTARLNVISTEYSWMEKQQAKLQSDYDRGLSLLKGGAK